MLLAELVRTSDEIAASSSRLKKIELLAGLLRSLALSEVPIAVGFLSGDPRQGKIGVGWATLAASMKASAAEEPSISIEDFDEVLFTLQATTGPGSVGARTTTLDDLFARATAPEADFIRRLLTGELRQGALQGIMAEGIAKASGISSSVVRRAAMLSGDLRKTADVAMSAGEPGLAEIGLVLFQPVLPMLASASEDAADAIAQTGTASVEWKLDGIRIQVHRDGDEVRVYTRNLNDITDRVPEIVRSVRELPASRLVLDGEAIVMGESDRPQMFQETMSRMGRTSSDQPAVAAAFFFDCLHRDGEDLIDLPLDQRLFHLNEAVRSLRIPSTITDDPALAEKILDEALAAGHEGIVAKALGSTYQAGRRGKSWRKVKRAKTLDLVILGAEWGHGRRQGWLSNLHLGARDPAGSFVMVGKTFKGLTDEMLKWQTQRLLELETHREGITVFTRPEIVVEIELDGVQRSTRYAGGVALRFARVKRYRDDKSASEADTIEAVRTFL